jgi:hypothetical protein
MISHFLHIRPPCFSIFWRRRCSWPRTTLREHSNGAHDGFLYFVVLRDMAFDEVRLETKLNNHSDATHVRDSYLVQLARRALCAVLHGSDRTS